MRTLIKTSFSIAMLFCFIACGQSGSDPEKAKRVAPPPPPVETSRLQEPDLAPILTSIPPNASREQMDRGVEGFISAFSKSRYAHLRHFTNALAALREQPQLVSSIAAYYDRVPKPETSQRLTTVAILGELKRPDAIPVLQKIVWTPMPDRQPVSEGLTPRDLEEMVIVKALQGLGYLRTPDTDKALIDIMQRHEARGVRISAISAYMWNHDDSNEAAQSLYQTLPADMHKFVERPRFHRSMDRNRFNEQLKAWQRKWGAPKQ